MFGKSGAMNGLASVLGSITVIAIAIVLTVVFARSGWYQERYQKATESVYTITMVQVAMEDSNEMSVAK